MEFMVEIEIWKLKLSFETNKEREGARATNEWRWFERIGRERLVAREGECNM